MHLIKGDIVKLADAGEFDLIIHGCNCQHVMGAGVAKQLARRWPQVLQADINNSNKGDITKLGKYTHCDVPTSSGDRVVIVNAYTQFFYGIRDQHFQYSALKDVLRRLRDDFYLEEMRIAYPKIGSGLGGGNWEITRGIFEEEFKGLDHTLVEYDAE